MAAAAIAVILFLPVGWPRKPSLFVGLAIVSLSMWAVLAPLALLAARRCRVLRLPDVVLATVLLFLIAHLAVMGVEIGGLGSRSIDGEACNGNSGRKLVTSTPQAGSGGPVYWACVSVAEYTAKRAVTPAPSVSNRVSAQNVEFAFNRLVKTNFASRSLVFGTIMALCAWLYAFGWRWHVRTDTL